MGATGSDPMFITGLFGQSVEPGGLGTPTCIWNPVIGTEGFMEDPTKKAYAKSVPAATHAVPRWLPGQGQSD